MWDGWRGRKMDAKRVVVMAATKVDRSVELLEAVRVDLTGVQKVDGTAAQKVALRAATKVEVMAGKRGERTGTLSETMTDEKSAALTAEMTVVRKVVRTGRKMDAKTAAVKAGQ
jgi:hypothetical protein